MYHLCTLPFDNYPGITFSNYLQQVLKEKIGNEIMEVYEMR